MRIILWQTAHAAASLAIGWSIFASYRWIRDRSTVAGVIVAAAILIRVTLGLTLFWVSFLGLPIAESLQRGGGFWEPALDATGYYQMAAGAAEAGTWARDPVFVPSPFFVNLLAVWMRIVGISPAAGLFLNLVLYVALAVALVHAFKPVNRWRQDLPCIISLGAYSLSPVVLLHSTQPLKDELTNVLLAMACLAVLGLRRLLNKATTGRDAWRLVASGIALIALLGAIAGIRWYFALLVWCALAVALVIFAVKGRSVGLPMYLARIFVLLLAAWGMFRIGAGPYYDEVGVYLRTLSRIAQAPSALLSLAQLHRAGFLMSGGATNITMALRNDPSPGHEWAEELAARHRSARDIDAPPAEVLSNSNDGVEVDLRTPDEVRADIERVTRANRAVPVGASEQLTVAVTGLAIAFVPLSALEMVLPIDMKGGQGMLWVADVDVVLLDVATMFVIALLWRRRHAIGDRRLVLVFGFLLSAVLAVLLGYVVTNFGTLSRMRPLVVLPIWMMVVALRPKAPCETAATTPDGSGRGTTATPSMAPGLR